MSATPGASGSADASHPESRSGTVIIVTATLTGLSTVVVLLRLYTRYFILNTAGSDDWTIAVAQLLSMASGASTILEAHYGLGRHLGTLTKENIIRSLECLFSTIFSYNIGMNVVKVSFLLQYRRIFPSQALRTICLWGLIFVGFWTVVQCVLLSMTCIPLAAIKPSAASYCLSTGSIWEFTSAIGLITDFAILMLPMPSLWALPISPRQRMVLFVIFGLGFFVCIVSIIRIPTLHAASMATDPTWNNVPAALWTLTEFNAAILCSSLPVLRPLIVKSTGHCSRKTITLDLVNRPPQPRWRADEYELARAGSRKKAMRSTVVAVNESSDDLVIAPISEQAYLSGGPENRRGSIYNTTDAASAAELRGHAWMYSSDKRHGFG